MIAMNPWQTFFFIQEILTRIYLLFQVSISIVAGVSKTEISGEEKRGSKLKKTRFSFHTVIKNSLN